jgi:hypothetical protein
VPCAALGDCGASSAPLTVATLARYSRIRLVD